ncbi:Anthocyanin 3'-O-beta-glucosyltransferase [Hordeum vulgare]|nr:Anthocyanin 3'-O-beta-glucosyltransferase [Hordeum vulgare]
MENALLKLWEMIEESKIARVVDRLESASTILNLKEAKNKLDANYEKLVQDVHQIMDMKEDWVVHFSYLQDNLTYQQQCRNELLADMKAEMAAEIAKKDADTQKLNQKYELFCNLTSAQENFIQNLKLKNMKEKELLSEDRMTLELKNAEFTKFEEKLSQEKLELKLQVVDLLTGKENHNKEKYKLDLKIVEFMRAEEDLKEKIEGI